jgi:hypothetical protein
MKTAIMLRFLTVSTLCGLLANAAASKDTPLKFSHDGTFQISVFEDLHFGDGTFNSLIGETT